MTLANNSQRQTATTVIYHQLKTAVTSGRLRPGEKLVEADLAEKFGVSRTPIREALKMLEKEKLVINSPYKGFLVARVSREEAQKVYEVRAVLEPLAARLAAERGPKDKIVLLEDCLRESANALREEDTVQLVLINSRFHQIIAELSGNEYLQDILNNLRHLVDLMRVSNFIAVPERMAVAVAEHKGIYDAIVAGDGIGAAERASSHIAGAIKLVPKIYQEMFW
ncbi:MAG: GntR family transcriptional regulator [Bacillota bacterium]